MAPDLSKEASPFHIHISSEQCGSSIILFKRDKLFIHRVQLDSVQDAEKLQS